MEQVMERFTGRFGREKQVFEYAAIDAPHTAETRIESRPAHRHFVHGKQRDPDDDSDLEAVDSNKANEARLKRLTSDSLAIFVRVGELFDQLPRSRLTGDKPAAAFARVRQEIRSEEHTSELQSHLNLVCRLLLE